MRQRTSGAGGASSGRGWMAVVLLLPAAADAAELDGSAIGPLWILPFVGVLASIAGFPLIAPDFWHRHLGKIAAAWAVAFLVPFGAVFGWEAGWNAITHAVLLEYVPFVVLLFALFTVAGGIGIFGDLHGTPRTNVAMLAIGAVMANLMGTTGAAMVLVRPLIRVNASRPHNVHVLVFFIFIVANAGGALTPLGDPPLFLGFLNGVSFFWTTTAMLLPTLALIGALLVLFYGTDRYFHGREDIPPEGVRSGHGELRIEGWFNFALLCAVAACVLVSGLWRPGVLLRIGGAAIEGQNLMRDAALLAIAGLSLATTRAGVRAANNFNWAPMAEVAKLFAAIFITIVPVIAILQAGDRGIAAGLTQLVMTTGGEPRNALYFWLTGVLSAVLDNAPTYLVFFNLAGGDAQALMTHGDTLRAISAGAVFMGALTYLGNAPNLMVWTIALESGIRMPTFFGYLRWSVPILVPLFAVMTFLFFR